MQLKFLQIIAFLLLILGMFIYNDMFINPWFRRTFLPSVDDPDPGTAARSERNSAGNIQSMFKVLEPGGISQRRIG
ncbi:unnamed protein product [Strongylus vulgaris]|uniref:Uncharacterized protein n=1 Tax=Strongylus vulgaris TaxID=40348 RepID=A0A3P7IG82_STRVU|nr:unnamed protein product [Strongylus vulgaris]